MVSGITVPGDDSIATEELGPTKVCPGLIEGVGFAAGETDRDGDPQTARFEAVAFDRRANGLGGAPFRGLVQDDDDQVVVEALHHIELVRVPADELGKLLHYVIADRSSVEVAQFREAIDFDQRERRYASMGVASSLALEQGEQVASDEIRGHGNSLPPEGATPVDSAPGNTPRSPRKATRQVRIPLMLWVAKVTNHTRQGGAMVVNNFPGGGP
jgi:hypothetical protein